MKNINFILALIIGLFVLNSCNTNEFLNPTPDSAITVDAFFATDADIQAGIMGIYDAIQGVNQNTESNLSRSNRGIQFEYMLSEMRSDNSRTKTLEGSKADFHRYLVDANNLESEDFYQSMYSVIFRANNILNYVDVADALNVNSYSAEAKFLRAFAYFKLVRLFSDVPLVTTVVLPTETDLLYTRVPESQIYDQIVADLREAINNLDNTYKARASKAAAQGLLAKVYMSQPSPNYGEARALCEAIINTGEFSLEPEFWDVFYSELNNEIIFAIQYESGNSLESQGFSAEFTAENRQGRDDGHNMVNENLRQDFAIYGGNRTALSYDTLGGDNFEVIKFLPVGSDITAIPPAYGANPRDAGNDAIILRYADVLLMYAEAAMAGGLETGDSKAIQYYMDVKVRAGFDADDDRPTILTRDALLAERRVELAFENQRFYDLVRFGVADNVLQAHANEMGYPDYDARKLLLPIPAREINLSKGLLSPQNPGY